MPRKTWERTSGGPMLDRSAASWRSRPAAGGASFPVSSIGRFGSAFAETIHNELQDEQLGKHVLFFFLFCFVLFWGCCLLLQINAFARTMEIPIIGR
jgi:hypothetical protein